MARKKRARKAKLKTVPKKTREDAAQDVAQNAARAPESIVSPAAPDADAEPKPAESQTDGPSDGWDEIPLPSDDEIDGSEEDAEGADDGGY
jgi:hypothetical protein